VLGVAPCVVPAVVPRVVLGIVAGAGVVRARVMVPRVVSMPRVVHPDGVVRAVRVLSHRGVAAMSIHDAGVVGVSDILRDTDVDGAGSVRSVVLRTAVGRAVTVHLAARIEASVGDPVATTISRPLLDAHGVECSRVRRQHIVVTDAPARDDEEEGYA
jgi:hypothetical protein